MWHGSAPLEAGDEELEEELRRAAAFRSALRRFSGRTEQVAAASGLTSQRYDLLLAIRAAPGGTSTVTELTHHLQLQQTAVTELVKRAQEAGLVLRAASPRDGRVTLLRLSAEGERRLMIAFHRLQQDRRQLRGALREVGARWRALDGEPRSPKA